MTQLSLRGQVCNIASIDTLGTFHLFSWFRKNKLSTANGYEITDDEGDDQVNMQDVVPSNNWNEITN